MIPRTAFCFHDAERTGASLWLERFLLSGTVHPDQAIAVLPARSPIADSLIEAGFAVHVVSVTKGDLVSRSPLQLIARLRNRIASVSDCAELFRREKIEVVYANTSVQIAPMLAARRAHCALMVHVHEATRWGSTHALKRHVLRSHAHVAAFAAESGLKLFGPPRARCLWEVSPNGVPASLTSLRERREELRAKNDCADRRVLLFVGVLNFKKGLRELLELWPHLREKDPSLLLMVAGEPNEFETDPVIRAFPTQPPEGTHYLGYRKDIHELMAAADFFILPSHAEAMPISIAEAMMIGTPVIARAVGDVPWQIGDERGFLYEDRQNERLQATIELALSQPNEAQRRAERARKFALEHLTAEQQQVQIIRLINETKRIATARA
jgi:glycosyltransferase involved in cell wall biosynthesis